MKAYAIDPAAETVSAIDLANDSSEALAAALGGPVRCYAQDAITGDRLYALAIRPEGPSSSFAFCGELNGPALILPMEGSEEPGHDADWLRAVTRFASDEGEPVGSIDYALAKLVAGTPEADDSPFDALVDLFGDPLDGFPELAGAGDEGRGEE